MAKLKTIQDPFDPTSTIVNAYHAVESYHHDKVAKRLVVKFSVWKLQKLKGITKPYFSQDFVLGGIKPKDQILYETYIDHFDIDPLKGFYKYLNTFPEWKNVSDVLEPNQI